MTQDISNLDKLNSDAPRQKEQTPLRSAVTNFSRFYGLFNKIPYHGDKNSLKQSLVTQFTNGRTDSLRDMSRQEYNALCNELERQVSRDAFIMELKRKRSDVLHQMQLYGIDTSDWNKVDRFCLDRRISGKRFRDLQHDELDALYKKLRAMRAKKKDNE